MLFGGYDSQEFISNRLGIPVDVVADTTYVQDITGETLQLYYWDTNVLTVDAGEAAGTVVAAKFAYSGILDSMGAMIANDGDSSVAFTTGTVLTTQKPCRYHLIEDPVNKTLEEIAIALTADFSNGDYCIDARNGMLYGKKATTGTSDTVAYKVATAATGGGTSISDNINVSKWGGTSLTAADAAADAESNAEIGGMNKSRLFGFNGTTWDRLRTAFTGILKIFRVNNDSSVGEEYSTVGGDFTATPTDSTNDIVLNVDSIGGVAITADNFVNGSLKVTKASDGSVNTILLDSIDWTSATKTLDTSGCTGAFTFATGDVVTLVLRGAKKADDRSFDATKNLPLRDVSDQHASDTLATVTNETDATSYYYLDVEDYQGDAVVQFEKTGGSDTVAVTIEASAQNDGTADSSCAYQAITQYGTTCLTAAAAASFADDVMFRIPCKGLKFIRVKVAVTISASDLDYTIYAGRAY